MSSLCIPGKRVPIDGLDSGMPNFFLYVSSQSKVHQDSLGFYEGKDEVGSTISTCMFCYLAFRLSWSGVFIGFYCCLQLNPEKSPFQRTYANQVNTELDC